MVKFGLRVKKGTGQSLMEFCQEKPLIIENILFQKQETILYRHHQIVSTGIRLIMLFAAKDGEALYSQQKQNLELTVAQIMSSLLQNSGLNGRK